MKDINEGRDLRAQLVTRACLNKLVFGSLRFVLEVEKTSNSLLDLAFDEPNFMMDEEAKGASRYYLRSRKEKYKGFNRRSSIK